MLVGTSCVLIGRNCMLVWRQVNRHLLSVGELAIIDTFLALSEAGQCLLARLVKRQLNVRFQELALSWHYLHALTSSRHFHVLRHQMQLLDTLSRTVSWS